MKRKVLEKCQKDVEINNKLCHVVKTVQRAALNKVRRSSTVGLNEGKGLSVNRFILISHMKLK